MKIFIQLFFFLIFIKNTFSNNFVREYPNVSYSVLHDTVTVNSFSKIKFTPLPSHYFDLGYFNEKALVKFNFEVGKNQRKTIQFYQTFVNKFQLFITQENKLIYKSESTGTNFLKQHKSAPYFGYQNTYLFDVDLHKGNYTGYLYINSPYSPMRGGVHLYEIPSEELPVIYPVERQFIWDIVFGFIGFACFVTVLLFFLIKEKYYLWFAIYAVINIANIYLTRGFVIPFYNFFYVFPYDIRTLLNSLWLMSNLIYFYSLIPKKHSNPYIRYTLLGFLYYILIIVCVFLFLPKSISNWHKLIVLGKPALFLSFVIIPIHLIIAIKKQYKLAKLFLATYSILFLNLFLHLFQALGWTKNVMGLATFLWEISVLVELLIFTFTFIYKYYQTNKEKLELTTNLVKEQSGNLKTYYETQESERKSIADNINDHVLQQLGSIRQRIESINSDTTKNINKTLDETIDDLKNISHNFLPKSLEKFGVLEAILVLLEDSLKYTNIKFSYHHHNLNHRLPESIEINLYRCLQELIQNTIKHSKATMVYVELYKINNLLICIYHDDGIGFKANQNLSNIKGIGLKNITSRIENLDGECYMEKEIEKGMRTTIKINLK